MATWLKQSTAVDVALGPFVDATDGVTPETALSLTQAECRLKKNAGAWAQKSQVTTAPHEEEGWYEVNLDATDTNTLGILVLAVYGSGRRLGRAAGGAGAPRRAGERLGLLPRRGPAAGRPGAVAGVGAERAGREPG